MIFVRARKKTEVQHMTHPAAVSEFGIPTVSTSTHLLQAFLRYYMMSCMRKPAAVRLHALHICMCDGRTFLPSSWEGTGGGIK